MKKKALIVIGVVVLLVLILIAVLPSLIDANRYKPEIQSKLGEALGRTVQIGNIKLSIFSGGVVVNDVSISDDPAFSRSPFLTAKELTVGVQMMPLIFSKQLLVDSISISGPQVQLLRNSAGAWNYSSMGGSSPAPGGKSAAESAPKGAPASSVPASSGGAGSLSVQKLTISNGKITVGTVGSRGKPLVYQDVNLDASDLSFTSQFPFKLTAKDPSNGAVKVEGKAGPINQADASLTPLNATIDVQHLDLGAAEGFLSPSSGIAGVVDFNGTLVSDGRQMSSKGTIKTTKLKLSAAGAPSTVPVNIDYDTTYELKQQTGVLKQGDIHIGKALARLIGSYNIAGETASIQMKMNGQTMPISDLEGVLPAVGVALPPGAALQGGTLDANLAISGPVDRLTIAGPISLSNTKLAGFSVGSKLGALSAFTGIGGGGGSDTVIQSLTTNLRQDPSGTHAQDLKVVIQSLGTITGDANISSGGQLNCKMVANLAGGGNSPVSQITSLPFGGGGGKKGAGGGGIPFSITGTTTNPVFVPDVAGIAAGAAQSQIGNALGGKAAANNPAAGVLGGFLKKK